MATQATPNKPPRPITKGQVSALLRAMRGKNQSDHIDGKPCLDSIEIINAEQLLIDAALIVNNDVERGVSS